MVRYNKSIDNHQTENMGLPPNLLVAAVLLLPLNFPFPIIPSSKIINYMLNRIYKDLSLFYLQKYTPIHNQRMSMQITARWHH